MAWFDDRKTAFRLGKTNAITWLIGVQRHHDRIVSVPSNTIHTTPIVVSRSVASCTQPCPRDGARAGKSALSPATIPLWDPPASSGLAADARIVGISLRSCLFRAHLQSGLPETRKRSRSRAILAEWFPNAPCGLEASSLKILRACLRRKISLGTDCASEHTGHRRAVIGE